MPPRLNKRQQRELEELEALGGGLSGGLTPVDTDSEEDAPQTAKAQSAFAALMASSNADEDEEEDEEDAPEQARSRKSKKSKKKKKKPTASTDTPAVATPTPAPSAPVAAKENVTPAKAAPSPAVASTSTPDVQSGTATPTMSKQERKALKKQRAKERLEKDDIDRALEELATTDPAMRAAHERNLASKAKGATSPAAREWHSLLTLQPANLDPDSEMRKYFGTKVVAQAKAESASSSSGPTRKPQPPDRTQLTRPRATWWPGRMREGLSMSELSDEECEGKSGWSEDGEERWWSVEYSKRYKGITRTFMSLVKIGDADGLFNILRQVPWHADTLLQLADIYSHREEHSTAVDFIDRAIFTYERAFIGGFNFSGSNRLDFSRVENRPFFLALHRQTIDQQRRGVFRTAFEWARLLWSLDPWSDPHGALLHLDFLAIKSGMHNWLLNVIRVLDGRGPLFDIPGWAYAKALALKANKDDEGAKEALESAVREWPSVVPLLADKCDIALSGDVRGHRAFRIFTKDMFSDEDETLLHLLSHLYVQRSAPLWKDPTTQSWFASIVESVTASGKLPSTPTDTASHVVVLGTPAQRLLSYIPQHLLRENFTCDPLPPPHAASKYDDAFFASAEDPFSILPTPRSTAAQNRLLERVIPDGEMRRQIQELFDAHPGLRGQFPGGVVQFAQIVGQLPEDQLEGLMVEAMELQGQRGMGGEEDEEPVHEPGRMPGGMPGEEGLVFVQFGGEDGGGDGREAARDENVIRAAPVPPVDHGAHTEADDDAEDDEDEDEEEEEEDVAPAPVRAIRHFLGRFWGGGRAEPESSEDEDAPGPRGEPRDDDVD
ncbi:unnamed protein product [Peniophora sp. CBMAI 1063]|nr:unnamed protein product [Peniophora sp. CBMAI 1063]